MKEAQQFVMDLPWTLRVSYMLLMSDNNVFLQIMTSEQNIVLFKSGDISSLTTFATFD